MHEMRSIEIDFDVHKIIESARNSFSETPNEVLKRLLGLGTKTQAKGKEMEGIAQGRPWARKGIELPHGTKLRMNYNGSSYQGYINDGAWIVEGKKYSSPSGAAVAVAITKDGEHTQLNGWNYWEARLPGFARWKKINSIRKT